MLPKFAGAPQGVDVIRTEQVGLYDVQVISSGGVPELIAWLNERDFAYSGADSAVFRMYIDAGWVFTVATVRASSERASEEIVSEGLVAALILRFATDSAVYPLALTAEAGRHTELLLYVWSDHKMATLG